MEWIKNNFEKLLLAAFGIFALVVGVMLSLSAFSASETNAAGKQTEKQELGQDRTVEVQKALADLTAFNGKPVWSAVKMGPHRSIRLFTAAPMVKKAGLDAEIRILDDAATQIREGVPNWWLYENGLDITRDDILKLDTDGDKFTNLEEFQGESNPRDPEKQPAFYTKLSFVERIEIPYQIRFSGVIDKDIQVKRLAPLTDRGVAPGKLDAKIGDELFVDDKRFKIKAVEDRQIEVDGQKTVVKHLILDDTLNPNTPVVIAEKQTVNLATYKAKVKSVLSGVEDTKIENEEFKFPDFVGYKILLKKIGLDFIEIEYSIPGQPPAKAQLKLAK